MKKIIVTSLAACFAATASADSSLSVELNQLSYEDSIAEAQPKSLSLSYQYRFHENLSVIGNFGKGVDSDNVDSLGESNDFSVNYIAGTYLKADIMPGNDLNVYGTLGYSKTELELEAFKERESDVSYGLGLDYYMSKSSRFYFEGKQLIDDKSIDMTTYNIGVQFKL